LSSLILIAISSNYAQSNLPDSVASLFDSVKAVYGADCYIGVTSNLIERLNKYQQYPAIKTYLKRYKSIRNTIMMFRLSNSKTMNNSAIILNMNAVFKDSVERNIVNAC
jgi:predicted GIY-YIG superfamily endonuclease